MQQRNRCCNYVFSLNNVPKRTVAIPGLNDPNQRRQKTGWKDAAYRLGAMPGPISQFLSRREGQRYIVDTRANHKRWQQELLQGLDTYRLTDKLRRYKHHLSHAANASSGEARTATNKPNWA